MSEILLIGYGAIGQYVVNALQASPHARVAAILCRDGRQSEVRRLLGDEMVCISGHDEVPASIDLVVECGGHSAMAQHLPLLLSMGKDVISVSCGALADAELERKLQTAAVDGGARLTLLSGAIGALDALSAASVGGLESVLYRGRKPPAGWSGSAAEELLDLDKLDSAVTFFEGSARQAALAFPKNANVAASVALAGIGLDNTKVELVADPSLAANRHEVEATGSFGQLQFAIEGKPLPGNPRSSALTAMSIVREIERRQSAIAIG